MTFNILNWGNKSWDSDGKVGEGMRAKEIWTGHVEWVNIGGKWKAA